MPLKVTVVRQNDVGEARLKYFLFEIFFSVFRMGLSRAKVRSAMRYSGGAIRYKANVAIAIGYGAIAIVALSKFQ